jgi:hypothetical protein
MQFHLVNRVDPHLPLSSHKPFNRTRHHQRRHLRLRLDGVEEAYELLVPVALHIAADDGAVKDVEGRQTVSSCHDACSRGSSF